MTDSLKRFTDALAQSYDGVSPTPAAARARVMRTLRSRSGVRRRWVPWFLVPLLTLGAGTALAASGQLPKLVAQMATWLGGDQKVTEAEAALQKAPPQHFTRTPAASRNEALAEPVPIPSAATALTEGPASTDDATRDDGASRSPKRSSHATRPHAASSHRTEPDEETAPAKAAALPTSTADESLALYKEAQQTHFRRGDCAAAVGLYSRYLAAFPTGQFVLEAKYNRGICFLRLGRTEEARRALEPFAQGRFGGYRQAEAKALLGTTRE